MQGFGILAGGMVAIVVSTIFNALYPSQPYAVNPTGSIPAQADYVWRSILMFGALPAALTYYWRRQLPETPRYTALVVKDGSKACEDMKVLNVEIKEQSTIVQSKAKSFGLFSKEFMRRHGLHLLGTASCWFLLDIAYYSQNLFQKDIFSAVGWLPSAKSMSALGELYKIARAQTLIALCGTVPGYWATVFLIDRIGRFYIQLMGFFFMTCFMFVLGFGYHHWTMPANNIGFIVIYGLTFFFANFGPNSTTFVVPAEIFPARFRSTCHGISAAFGKAGAIIGAFGFLYASQNQDKAKADAGIPAGIGMKNSLLVLAGINAIGLFFTFLVPESTGGATPRPRGAMAPPTHFDDVLAPPLPESKGKSLEEMSRENEEQEQVGDLENPVVTVKD
ncbi:hypothetical protein ACLB2K_019213 [Fragaria x ananassa]